MSDDTLKTILAGDTICFAKAQLPEITQRELTKSITELGGNVVDVPEGATVVLVNPGSPLYKPVTDADSASGSVPHLPYHWIAQCAIRKARLDRGQLEPAEPFMQHAGVSKAGAPVHIYVSKNVFRPPGELDLPVWRIVGDQLSRAGAIIVTKRADADVLIVDRQSDFYKGTIKKEIVRFKRTHQRVAEREWVDQCIAARRFLSITQQEMEEAERAEREDSFTKEDTPPPKNKGGRPVGVARNDYTPEDDDFLCRYLAAYHPDGSHGSRKTYRTMCERQDQFPLVQRHSPQSWHERFKKNAIAFGNRVTHFKGQGIDQHLQTAEERKKTREVKAARAAAQAAKEAGNDVVAKEAAAEAATQPNDKGKRKLVSILLSDDDAPPADSGKGKKKASAKQNPVGRSARIEALGPAPPVATQPSALTTSTESEQEKDTITEAVLPEPVVEATPAIPSDIIPSEMHATKPIEKAQPAKKAQPVPQSTQTPKKRMIDLSTPRTPVTAAPAAVPATAPPASAVLDTPFSSHPTTVPGTAPPAGQPVPPTPDLSSSVPHPSTPATPAASSPTRPKRVRISEPVRALAASPPPPPPPPRAVAGPSRRALEAQIAEATHRKQANADSAAKKRRKSTITIAKPQHVPPAVPAVPQPRDPNVPQPEILTPAQRAERVAAGAQAVQATKEQYRQRIVAYTAKYKLKPAELMGIVTEVTKGSSPGSLYWDAVDRGLQQRFGF